MSLDRRTWLGGAVGATGWALAACSTPPPKPAASHPWQALIDEARALQAVMPASTPVREFFDAVPRLPTVAPRTLYRHPQHRTWLNAAQWAELPEAERSAWTPRAFDATTWASTFYGTPLAYALALNMAARHGLDTLRARKVVDYGYGAIGAPRLMAQAGAQVTGIDVDPMLALLYAAPGDTGALPGGGALRLVQANFPGDGSAAAVGDGVHLFVSKNTLKKGYVRPDAGEPFVRPPVPWPDHLRAVRATLAPGGLFVIYNISARLDPANYRPANDPRSPFARDEFSAAGFEVLALDAADGALVRQAGQALGWGAPTAQGGMGDLQNNLFAMATVARAR
jgi:hypothetical protein